MTSQDAWTIGQLLTWTTQYLKEQGIETPRLDAEVLLASARGCSRILLYTSYDQVASPETRAAFRELVRRRAAGMPVAYLVGHREFYSLDFHVTPDVLIPRPETELLVVTLLDRAREMAHGQPLTVADVGTGCGAIAVCAAKYAENCRVTAIDISPAALKVAAKNVHQHGVENRVELMESDLLAAVTAGRAFDLIASNPPYVCSAEVENLPREVRDHEPLAALQAGPVGTEVIERLIDQAWERLKPGGWLLMEIGPGRLDAVVSLLGRRPGYRTEPVVHDLAGLPRVVQAQKSLASNSPP